MKKLHLTFACGDYEIIQPLKDGSVQIDGVELTVLTGESSRDRTWRLSRNAECDLCEFNLVSYLMAKSRGHVFTALPIFLHRRFRHGFIFVRDGGQVRTPADLAGKRVGALTYFTPASNTWMRGIIQDDYGVRFDEMTWVTTDEEFDQFEPAPGLKIELHSGADLENMLLTGQIDALFSPTYPRTFFKQGGSVRQLFSDPKVVEQEYFARTGIFPIMHTTTIRQDLVDRYPWLPNNLARAFQEAKTKAYERLRNPRILPLAWITQVQLEQRQLLGPDPWEYGLTNGNVRAVEALIRYCRIQGLLAADMDIRSLFTPIDPHVWQRSYDV